VNRFLFRVHVDKERPALLVNSHVLAIAIHLDKRAVGAASRRSADLFWRSVAFGFKSSPSHRLAQEGVKKPRCRGGPCGRPGATIRQAAHCPYDAPPQGDFFTPSQALGKGSRTRNEPRQRRQKSSTTVSDPVAR
jgi:hypothetical protein